MYLAIKDHADLRVFLGAIFIGCAYSGYEVIVNGAGNTHHGRLEGIGFPAMAGANGASGLMTVALPIGTYFFLTTRSLIQKIAIVAFIVMVVDTILRCNSRGSFLAAICAGVWLLVASRGNARKRVVAIVALGFVAVLIQARNDFIWERFSTTFASVEDRDKSANDRIEYWKAAVNLIGDYPLGLGGEAAFNSPIGFTYMYHIRTDMYRAVHNGYLDIGAGWGLQGLTLLLGIISLPFLRTWKTTRVFADEGCEESVLLGSVLQSVLVSQLVVALFISTLDSEVFIWIVAAMLRFGQLESDPVDELPIESPQSS